MSNTPLFQALIKYVQAGVLPFDVPGHKRNPLDGLLEEFMNYRLVDLDVSSAKPIDFLGNPSGPLREAMSLMAKEFSAGEAFFLVNGTTSGVQSMILSQIGPKEKILLPRNLHKSAMNALILSGAQPIYIYPEFDQELGVSHGVSKDVVKQAIGENKDAKSIFLINPTYYGATSDLEEIVGMAHKNSLTVMVDEAHGGHFYFHQDLPLGAMEIGCDLSSVSLHKTGGSLTQSSILLAHKKRIDINKIASTIDLMQTTSPSYLLLASLDVAREVLATRGEEIFTQVISLADYGRQEIRKIKGYQVLGQEDIGRPGIFNLDLSKLTIKVSDLGLTGMQVYDLLRDEYKIQVEVGEIHTILALVSMGDSKESLDHLVAALKDIKAKYSVKRVIKTSFLDTRPQMILSPREAFYTKTRAVLLKDAVGEISGESVMAYPPGIPIVAPGEKLTKEIVEYLEFMKREDGFLTGSEDPKLEYIYILGG